MSGELDPNADLFGSSEEEESQGAQQKALLDHVFGKNPKRVIALEKLWYDDMTEKIKNMELPSEEAKLQMVFNLTAGGLLDMFADSQDSSTAPDMMTDFDIFMGVALTNKRFGVDLFKEHDKALLNISPSKFKDDEEYQRTVADFEDAWWDLAQPPLGGRTPNDAIKETLRLYELD